MNLCHGHHGSNGQIPVCYYYAYKPPPYQIGSFMEGVCHLVEIYSKCSKHLTWEHNLTWTNNKWTKEFSSRLTWQGGSTHGLCSSSQHAGEVGAVIGEAAVHWADEAGASTAHVAVHDWAPGAPQWAVPFTVAGGRRALETGVSQAEGRGLRLSGGGIIVRLSGVDWDVTHGGGGGMGQEGTLHRQGAADREVRHGHITTVS